MDGGIAQPVGDLGKIQLVAANQFLGCVDFHQGEKFHHPAAVQFLKQLLQPGAADQSVFANIFNGQLFIDVLLHVTDNPVIGLIGASQAGMSGIRGRNRQGVGKIAAVQMDEQFLQIIADQLLRPKTGSICIAHQFLLVRVV